MKTKIVITVQNGIVETIDSNNENIEIIIVDVDQKYIGEKFISRTMGPNRTSEYLYELFNENNSTEVEVRKELKRRKF